MGIEVLLAVDEEDGGGSCSSTEDLPPSHEQIDKVPAKPAKPFCNVEVSLLLRSQHSTIRWESETEEPETETDTETGTSSASVVAQSTSHFSSISTSDFSSQECETGENKASISDASNSYSDSGIVQPPSLYGSSATSDTVHYPTVEYGGGDDDGDDDNCSTNNSLNHEDQRGAKVRLDGQGSHHHQQLRHFPPSSLTVEDVAYAVGDETENNTSSCGSALSGEGNGNFLGSMTSMGGSMLESITSWNTNRDARDTKQERRISRRSQQTRRSSNWSIGRRSSTEKSPRHSKRQTTRTSQQKQDEEMASIPGAFQAQDMDDEEIQRGFETVATRDFPAVVPLAAELAPQIEEIIAERDQLRQELEYSRNQLAFEQGRKSQEEQQRVQAVALQNSPILVESVAIVPNKSASCCQKLTRCRTWVFVAVVTVITFLLVKGRL